MSETSGPEMLACAQAFMSALYGWVQRNRLYPHWAQKEREADALTLEALQALHQQAPQVTFAVQSPGLRINGTPLDPLRGGDIVWDFVTLLSERLLESVSFRLGVSPRELAAFVREMSLPLDRTRIPLDHWERFLKREGISHIQLAQRAFVSRDEGESVILQRGGLVGDRALDADEVLMLWPALKGLHAAASALRQFPPEDPRVQGEIQGATEAVLSLLNRSRVVTLSGEGDRLSANGQELAPTPEAAEAARFLARDLAHKGMLTIKDGMTGREVCALISALSVPPDNPVCAQTIRQIVKASSVRRFVFAPTGPQPAVAAPPPTEPAHEELPEVTFVEIRDRETKDVVESLERKLLSKDPGRVPSEETLRTFAALLEHANAQVRDRLLSLARRVLVELRDDSLQRSVSHLSDALKRRLLAEADPSVQRNLAETLRLWISAAVRTGGDEATDMICAGVKPVLDSPKISREFKAALTSKIRSLATELSPGVSAMLVNGPAEVRETAIVVLGVIGPLMISPLVRLATTTDRAEVRQAAARALGAIGGTGQMELARPVTAQADAETALRVLGVLDLAGSTYLATPILAGLSHSVPSVRDAAIALLERSEGPMVGRILQQLITGSDRAMVLRAIGMATHRRAPEVRDGVTQILAMTEDEETAVACCGYFRSVPAPTAMEALRRIFEMRPKAFGFVRGWSDETRAAAVAAARAAGTPAAEQIVAAARKDASPVVRAAAGG
ncbi:MAG: hypothetical protein HYY16_13560 [Planctomycetes bacterium]|nr:hypothetical protein [Planctomycetota bacterium]